MSQRDQLKNDAIEIWRSGVAAVDARKLTFDNVAWSKDELRIGTEMFSIPEIDRLIVIGFGKASGAMAVGFEQALGERLFDTFEVSGLVNVPSDQTFETQSIKIQGCRPAGHNFPTEEVVASTTQILELVASAGPNDIVVCLISGGGSALLEKPIAPITLDEVCTTSKFLSESGASIFELNAVRRVISDVKGGRLGLHSGGAPVVSLIVSDVVGDDLEIIASGPTVVSNKTVPAIDVLNKFDPQRESIPATVWAAGAAAPTGDVQLPWGLEITNCVIGNIDTAMNAASEKARELGYAVERSQPSANEGDAALVGQGVAAQILQSNGSFQSVCQIAGGETTVQLAKTSGQGGRNQHLVLAAAQTLLSDPTKCGYRFCLLSGGTDGEDGNVSVAGAWVDSDWVDSHSNGESAKIIDELKQARDTFDSHRFLAEYGLVFDAPGTSTNVGDLRIVLKQPVDA